jgi:hypothetical protein
MGLLSVNVAALTVVCIYYMWRVYRFTMEQRERILRDRVTYMLWTMAHRRK